MEYKLNRDEVFIGDKRDLFYAIYSRLDGAAAKQVESYFTIGGIDRNYDPVAFIAFLKDLYLDLNRPVRAARELYNIRQKPDERFTTFFTRFERTLADAGGALWQDGAKLVLLQGAINERLDRELIPVAMPTHFQDWVQRASEVAAKIEIHNARSYPTRYQGTTTSKPRASKDDDGDIKMTGVNATTSTGSNTGLGAGSKQRAR